MCITLVVVIWELARVMRKCMLNSEWLTPFIHLHCLPIQLCNFCLFIWYSVHPTFCLIIHLCIPLWLWPGPGVSMCEEDCCQQQWWWWWWGQHVPGGNGTAVNVANQFHHCSRVCPQPGQYCTLGVTWEYLHSSSIWIRGEGQLKKYRYDILVIDH